MLWERFVAVTTGVIRAKQGSVAALEAILKMAEELQCGIA